MVEKHKLRINISDEPAADALVSTRTVSLRERLLAGCRGRVLLGGVGADPVGAPDGFGKLNLAGKYQATSR
ncbi:hypothetical protein OS123_07330 [Corynebacterium sp. P5875]|uniref:Uncharacterized protein n=1 Tax=Corynebacterium antarcticum TaxID=2800405 RepID=A0A9Q4CCM4_9CORY|nr:hypothetical protein [Corynebacterium antarcticum]MCX7538351.1 hypothetical protein [Corynebacterium antarcticum]